MEDSNGEGGNEAAGQRIEKPWSWVIAVGARLAHDERDGDLVRPLDRLRYRN